MSRFTSVVSKVIKGIPSGCLPIGRPFISSTSYSTTHTKDRTDRNCLLQTQNNPQVNPYQHQNPQDVGPRIVGCFQHRLLHTRPGQGHQHTMGKALHNLRRATNDPWAAHRLPGPRCHQGHPVNAVLCLCQPTDDTPAEYLLRSTRPDQGHSIDALLCLRHGPEVKFLET